MAKTQASKFVAALTFLLFETKELNMICTQHYLALTLSCIILKNRFSHYSTLYMKGLITQFFTAYFDIILVCFMFKRGVFWNSPDLKSVPIRSFFWSVFPRIWTEYGHLRSIQSKCKNIRTIKTPQDYDQKRKLFRTNSFVPAQSSAKKIYNEQLTLKSTIQWYHMTEYDVI